MSYQQQTKIVRSARRGYSRASERNGLTLADIEAFVADCRDAGIRGNATIIADTNITLLVGISCREETVTD